MSGRSSPTVEDDTAEKLEKVDSDAERFAPELESKDRESCRQESSKPTKSKPKYDASLLKALHTTFFWRWWIAGALKLVSGTS